MYVPIDVQCILLNKYVGRDATNRETRKFFILFIYDEQQLSHVLVGSRDESLWRLNFCSQWLILIRKIPHMHTYFDDMNSNC